MINIPEGPKETGKKSKTAKPNPVKSTRTAQLRKLLTRKNGATIAQIQSAFGWQAHTARAAISGIRKSGEIVQRSDTAKEPVYRIVTDGTAQ